MSKVSLVTPSTESLNNLKTSSFPHFLFPRLSVWTEAIINISSSLSSTVGVLKFNVAGELNFNDASESWHDDVVFACLDDVLVCSTCLEFRFFNCALQDFFYQFIW